MPKWKAVCIDPMNRSTDVEAAALGPDVEFISQRCTRDDEVVALAGDAHAILVVGYPVTDAVMAQCPQLRVIVRYGVGYDCVDLEAATRRGVMVCNVPDYCIDEVANHAMALLLALNRRLISLNSSVRSGAKATLAPMGPLRGETLGLLGYGRLARAVADRATAFGLRIMVHDPYLPDSGIVRSEPLEAVLSAADYLSIHVPLTNETRGMIGAPQLALMKPTAYLISTARGGIVSEHALADALAAGTIAGAGLDVWESEPLRPDHPLLTYPQVVATPHIAYYSNDSAVSLRRRVGEITLDALRGNVPASTVNPGVRR